MSTYEGNAYQIATGQWGWYLNEDGEQVVNRTGYETRDAAWNDMYDELCRYMQDGGCSY